MNHQFIVQHLPKLKTTVNDEVIYVASLPNEHTQNVEYTLNIQYLKNNNK